MTTTCRLAAMCVAGFASPPMVSEIKLVVSIPPARPSRTSRRRGQLRAPDDLCRSSDAKDLDEKGYLVEQVPVSIVLAPFSEDDQGYETGSDFLNPAGVFQNAICCGYRRTNDRADPRRPGSYRA